MEVGEQGKKEPAGAVANGATSDGRSEAEQKLWATVSATPSDFKSWTALLQLTEQNVRPG